jgi:hypothetical protein
LEILAKRVMISRAIDTKVWGGEGNEVSLVAQGQQFNGDAQG